MMTQSQSASSAEPPSGADPTAPGVPPTDGELFSVLQGELRSRAGKLMRDQSAAHTLQATALVNEAWLKLSKRPSGGWNDRRHFLATAALAMRQILRDHAKRKGSLIRTPNGEQVPLEDLVVPSADGPVDFLELDEALKDLERFDPKMARIFERHFFAGCSLTELSEMEDIPIRTLQRKMLATKAWLADRLA